jgi:hypothetical protein
MIFNTKRKYLRFASLVAAAAGAVVLGQATAAHADRRAFGYTYEYNTMAAGGLDLELWNTQARSSFDGGAASGEWKAEVEYGITDHWDLAVYQTFGQDGHDGAVGYRETSVESRYRFAERGQWPVDVLVYLEVAKGFGETAWDVEPKLVLARDLGKVSVNFNFAPEVQITKHGDAAVSTALSPRWALGAAYELSPRWKVGAETFGEADLDAKTTSAAAGPSLSWAPSTKLWVASTAAVGLTHDSDDFSLRFVLGIGL